MNFPVFKNGAYEIKKKIIDKFGGLSRDEGAYENEFSDTFGISGDAYPYFACLYDDVKQDILLYDLGSSSPHTPTNIQGVIVPGIYTGQKNPPFCGVCDNKFYFDGYEVQKFTDDKITISDGQKEIIDFYGKIVILPDRLFYCYTAEYDEYYTGEDLTQNNWDTAKNKTKYLRRMGKGKNLCYVPDVLGINPSSVPTDGVLVAFADKLFSDGDVVTVEQVDANGARIEGSILNILDISSKYKSASDMQAVTGIVQTGETYVRPTSSDVSSCIYVKYINSKGENIRETYNKYDQFNDAVKNNLTRTVPNSGKPYYSGYFNVRQYVPSLVCACVRDNRLWGSDADGRTIYASKLGSIDNWSEFKGLDSDSFTAEVGTDGEFLTFINYKTALVGFKKDHIHILYGNTPKTYQLTKSISVGLTNKEAVIEIDGVIYFNSYDGIYAFTLGVPEKISDKLNVHYGTAHFATDGRKLYIGGNTNGKYENIVYDTRTRLWIKRSSYGVKALFGDRKYVYELRNDNKIYLLDGKTADENTKWEAVTNYMTDADFGRKCTTDLYFAANIYGNAKFDVYISYDGGEEVHLKTFSAKDRFIKRMPVRIKASDRYKLKFKGKGKCEILGIEKQIRISGRNMNY
nr:MAG TPA: stabilization protein [Caudoviricetes sp.]